MGAFPRPAARFPRTFGVLPECILPRTLCSAVALLLAYGCTDQHGKADAAPHVLDDAVVWGESFEVEENEAVINVVPVVAVDPRGGYLVADPREAQLRKYGADGRLHWYTGSRGGAPGQFSAPLALVRLHTGELLAADRDGRLTLFDSVAGRVIRTVPTPFTNLEDVDVVDDSLVLVSAQLRDNQAGPRLHLWNSREDSVVRSFFNPFGNARNKVAATIAGWSKAAVRGDTVAAIFALSDSIHLFDLSGKRLAAVPIPFTRFRRVGPDVPDAGSNPRLRAAWLASFDYVGDVHWAGDGGILVSYQTLLPDGALTREWHLLGMSRTGTRTFDAFKSPRLLAVHPGRGELLFVDPLAEEPNRWIVARLQP